jgi:hypothetical protein
MEIGTVDDQSSITVIKTVGDNFYVVKEKGIYTVQLADQIDPKRTNPAIPHVQQRIVALGSDSPLVGKTFLAATELFSRSVLPSWFDCDRAILLALEALKDLAAACEVRDEFISAEDGAVGTLSSRPQVKGALVLPALGDVEARCKTFLQKADHACRSLLNIVKLFHKKLHGVKGMADLIAFAKEHYGETDPLVTYLDGVAPTMKYVRDARNGLEHPNAPTKITNVTDFSLRADGLVVRPQIEVIWGPDHYPSADISAVMNDLVQALPEVFEGVIAALCEKHITEVGGFRPFLIRIDPTHRRREEAHVQFAYGVKVGDKIGRLG